MSQSGGQFIGRPQTFVELQLRFKLHFLIVTRGQWPFRLPSNSAMNHDGSGLMASITHAFMLFFLLNASISPSSIKFPRTHLPILLRTANLVGTGH